MPEDFETRFREEVRKREQRRKRRMIRKFSSLFLIFALVVLSIYLFSQKNIILQISNLSIHTILLSIFGLIVIISLIVYFTNLRESEFDQKSPVFSVNTLKDPNSGEIQWKYILGVALLLSTFVYQANQFTIDNHIHTLIYRPKPPVSNQYWPWNNYGDIDPIVANLPSDVEISIQSVAQYIAREQKDPYLQVKALHDYVVSRVTYDLEVLKTGIRPPQDAKTVFQTHKAVCEGYAKLFAALGRSIGLNVVYLEGKVRRDLAPVDLIPRRLRFLNSGYDWTLHAWNAVKVAGQWQLIDATWDDSNSNKSGISYNANYLMPPPEVMIISHLPDLSSWQLLKNPTDQDKFEKQPLLTPYFFSEELDITSPKQYESSVQKTAVIEINTSTNYRKKIVAVFTKAKKTEFSIGDLLENNQSNQRKELEIQRCSSQISGSGKTKISCQLPEKGDYQIFVFSAGRKVIPIGQLKFHAI
ncbi:transglutaminase domain-containing protein [Mastigocoleus testarum]|uniref:Transglutaminase-like domain-containing protein n=1 Tax=Mastigocoleus testarum BC008 TaxID=371196 RepID=A0A0V7ZY54_9CYAN|nr:transglutaminase domain-containing protein [Mastigocoleus testarum]KST69354.1 hypothetical protein BC008_03965 [Mastigocoleus testarum BC008]KST69507.1 hypothetical protein BC008_04200 [Mastigocoleus testarum BC008]